MSKDHSLWYQDVENYIKENPEAAPNTAIAINQGLSAALWEIREQCGDMEILALSGILLASHPKRDKKRNEALFKDKISKWRHKAFLNWDWYFKNKEKK